MDDVEIRRTALSYAARPEYTLDEMLQAAAKIEKYLRGEPAKAPTSTEHVRLPNESTRDAIARLSAAKVRTGEIAKILCLSRQYVTEIRKKLGIVEPRAFSPEQRAAARSRLAAARQNRPKRSDKVSPVREAA